MGFVVWALLTCLATASAGVLDGSILQSNIKVVKIDEDSKTAEIVFSTWQPSQKDIDDAESDAKNPENLAAQVQKYYKSVHLKTVVDGQRIDKHEENAVYLDSSYKTRTDFIDIPINLTYSSTRARTAAQSYVVETLVVCDKEFGDVFQQNIVKILDYLTVYFWDINMRYKTMPSLDISFRVTGVVAISSTSGQPFIEQARAPDGRAEFGRILPRFSSWVYENQPNFAKFDLAILLTNTNLEWGGGLAYLRHTCRNAGSAVFSDNGQWGSNTIGTHEIGHTLGAPHDEDVADCQSRGYIMSGAQDHLRWFFSECSERAIRDFVTSDQASCLRRIDDSGWNPISPDFSFIKPPSMDEQCKMRLGPTALVEEPDTANCKRLRCLVPKPGGYWVWMLEFPDNSPCLGGGRCFRGNCRKPDFRVVNVGSGQCLKASNPFAFTVRLEMVPCLWPGTPLDRFAVSDTSLGKTLGTPWQSADAQENGDRCVYTGVGEGGGLWTDRCGENPWHGWDFIDMGNSEFVLKHRVTGRCAKQVESDIQTFSVCDINDKNMRWKLD